MALRTTAPIDDTPLPTGHLEVGAAAVVALTIATRSLTRELAQAPRAGCEHALVLAAEQVADGR